LDVEEKPKILNLDIILAKANGDYTARASTSDGRGAIGELMNFADRELLGTVPLRDVFDPRVFLPGDSSEFVLSLRQLQNTGLGVQQLSLVTDVVKIVGQGLYRALPEDIRILYHEAWGAVQADSNKLLRVRLHFDAPELGMLPWEYMKVGKDGDDNYLCGHHRRSLVRYPDAKSFIKSLSIPGTLKVLIWVANPKGTDKLDTREEVRKIKQGLETRLKDKVDIQVAHHGSALGLFKMLVDGGYHVLHYIGHGDLCAEDGKPAQGMLAFEDTEGAEPTWVTSDRLKPGLDNDTLQLVFLNACKTAAGVTGSAYASLGFDLARYTPAVIAMQYAVYDESAIIFAEEFYEILSSGELIDICVTRGRQALMTADGVQEMDWGIPTLFTRTVGGEMLSVRPGDNINYNVPISAPPTPKAQYIATTPTTCAPPIPSDSNEGDLQPLSKEDSRYLRNVRQNYSRWHDTDPGKFISGPLVPIEQLGPLNYVPVGLTERRWSGQGGPTVRPWSICEMMNELMGSQRLLILGRPGIGKSSLLSFLACQYASLQGPMKGTILPVMVSLKNWGRSEKLQSLTEYIRSFLASSWQKDNTSYPDGSDLAPYLEDYLDPNKETRLLFLLDDLNRMPREDSRDYERRIKDLYCFSNKHKGATIIITCRTLEYNNELDDNKEADRVWKPSFMTVEIDHWREEQIKEYLKRYATNLVDYAEKNGEFDKFLSMADVPYQLVQIVEVSRAKQLPPEQILHDDKFIVAFVEQLFEFGKMAGRLKSDDLRKQVSQALTYLAKAMFKEVKHKYDYVDYCEALKLVNPDNLVADAANLLQVAADTTIVDVRPGSKEGVGFEMAQLEDYFANLTLDEIKSVLDSQDADKVMRAVRVLDTPKRMEMNVH
jgi:hypothetical protein